MTQLVYRVERRPDRSVALSRGPFPGRAGPALLGLTVAGGVAVAIPLVLGAGLAVQWLTGSGWLLEHGATAGVEADDWAAELREHVGMPLSDQR